MKYKLWGLLDKGISRNSVVILEVWSGQKGNFRMKEMLISKIAFLLSETFLVILLLLLKWKKNGVIVSSHIPEENYSPFLFFCCELLSIFTA